MTKKEIIESIERFKNHQGLLSVSLKDGQSFPCRFHSSHINRDSELKEIEEKNEWLIDVIPGFGRGWQQKIKGDEVKGIQSTF